MAEYEEFAASAGYDSDDSDGADTDEEVKNSFIILFRERGWGREFDLTVGEGEGQCLELRMITIIVYM